MERDKTHSGACGLKLMVEQWQLNNKLELINTAKHVHIPQVIQISIPQFEKYVQASWLFYN